jgi:hypothetical protein
MPIALERIMKAVETIEFKVTEEGIAEKWLGAFEGVVPKGRDQHRIYQEAARELLWKVLGFFWKQTDFTVNSHLILLIIKMSPVIRVLENQEYGAV